MNETTRLLKMLGFNNVEIKLYVALISKGPSTILSLSKATKLNRTTVHMSIGNLIKKGVVTEVVSGARRQIIAKDPTSLELQLDQERMQLKEKEKSVSELISNLRNLAIESKQSSLIQVRYFNGIDEVRSLYDIVLNTTELRCYINAKSILQLFPENEAKFINSIKKGVKIWDIQEANYEDDPFKSFANEYSNYKMKTFPSTSISSLDYTIFDEGIILVQKNENNELIGIMLQNKLIVENSKFVYDLMWNLLP